MPVLEHEDENPAGAGGVAGANEAGWGVKVNMPPPQLNSYSCYDDYKTLDDDL